MPQVYYKIHLPALSYAECWRAGKRNPLLFAILALLKTLRISPNQPFALARPEYLVRMVPDAVPPVLKSLLKPYIVEAKDLDLSEGIWYTVPLIGSATAVVVCSPMPRGDGVLVCSAIHAVENGVTIEKKATASFVSELRDGRFLRTSATKDDLLYPSSFDVLSMPGQPLEDVLARHRTRLTTADEPVVPVTTEDDLERLCVTAENRLHDYNVQRGALIPISKDDEARLRAMSSPEAADDPEQSMTTHWLNWVCFFAIGFGAWKLSEGAANEAQLIFRWSLIGGGALGLLLLAGFRRFRRNAA